MRREIIELYYKNTRERAAALAVYKAGAIGGWLTMGAFVLFVFGVYNNGIGMSVESIEVMSASDMQINPEHVKELGDRLSIGAGVMTWWFLAAFAPGRYLRGLRAKSDVRISLWLSLILTLPFFFTGIGAIYTIACIVALRRLSDYVPFDDLNAHNSN